MGWKGSINSIGAAVRAAERDAKRRQRELDKRQKQYDKMQELEQAAYEVEVYENHIDIIQSLHKECNPCVDWQEISSSQEPQKPEKLDNHEKEAQVKADRYKPGFIDRLFKREEKKKRYFKDKIEKGITQDISEYQLTISKWEQELSDWIESVGVARSLLSGDEKARIKIIDDLNPFSEISNLGTNLIVSIGESGMLEATVNVHGDEIVPNEVKSLLRSGKLSIKNMPKGKFNEIYQDYVCSCVLRVANEIFSAIPDDLVIVTAVDELLNTKTGHLEESPILSACISRSTIQSLNMFDIDPSDSMNNFIHNMSFKKINGFEPVSRVEPEILQSI